MKILNQRQRTTKIKKQRKRNLHRPGDFFSLLLKTHLHLLKESEFKQKLIHWFPLPHNTRKNLASLLFYQATHGNRPLSKKEDFFNDGGQHLLK